MRVTIDASAGPRGIATPLRAPAALTPKRSRRFAGPGIVVLVACVAALFGARSAGANADCRPPAYVQRAVREAERVRLVRLQPTGDCSEDPPAGSLDPACFVGYRRAASIPLAPGEAGRVSRLLAVKNLACGPAGKATGAEYVVGLDVTGGGGALRATLRLPSGELVFEIPNGARFQAALTSAGLADWRRMLDAVASSTGRTSADLERDLSGYVPTPPPSRPARPIAEADTAAVRWGDTILHPVVPDIAPEAITKVSPTYPDLAREAGVDGRVLTRALVGESGAVLDVRVVKSVPGLDEAAVAAVVQWRFRPGQSGGRNVTSWVEVPVKFSLH